MRSGTPFDLAAAISRQIYAADCRQRRLLPRSGSGWHCLRRNWAGKVGTAGSLAERQ
jgi:hypothetical protein